MSVSVHPKFAPLSEANHFDSLDGGVADFADFGLELVVPDVSLLLDGRYQSHGDDLVITGADGKTWTVDGYFSSVPPPVLLAPNGALLLPETVKSLLSVDQTAHATMVAGPSMIAEAASSIGKVDEAVGQVVAKGIGGEERILKVGDAVFKGDILQTLKGGLVTLVFVDGTRFKLAAEARAILDNYVYNPEIKQGGFEATITRGIFSFESGAISGLNTGRHSSIKTPTAVIGIRGSQLTGEVMADGSTSVVHTAGILDISDARGQGTVTLVEPGTATQVIFGAGAPEPVFKAPANFISRLEIQLDVQKAKEDRKSEDSGDSGNRQEQKPEGKKENGDDGQGQKENQGERDAAAETKSEAELKKEVEPVHDTEEILEAGAEALPEVGKDVAATQATKGTNADPEKRTSTETARAGGGSEVESVPVAASLGTIAEVGRGTGGEKVDDFSLADLIGTGRALEGAFVDVGSVGETLTFLAVPVTAKPEVVAKAELVPIPVSIPSPAQGRESPVAEKLQEEPQEKPQEKQESREEQGSISDAQLQPKSDAILSSPPEPIRETDTTLADFLGTPLFTATPELTVDSFANQPRTEVESHVSTVTPPALELSSPSTHSSGVSDSVATSGLTPSSPPNQTPPEEITPDPDLAPAPAPASVPAPAPAPSTENVSGLAPTTEATPPPSVSPSVDAGSTTNSPPPPTYTPVIIHRVNHAPSVTSGGSARVVENVTDAVYMASGTDPDEGQTLSWSLGGTDVALFNVNSSTGQVFFNSSPNFEISLDRGTDNVYDITVIVTDNGTGNLSASQAVTVTVTNMNEAPAITSRNRSGFAENGIGTVYTASGTDPDREQTLSWRLDGPDAALFGINSVTGDIFFNSPPDFELPLDHNASNTYKVAVTATDNGAGSLTASQAVTIVVTNVNESPSVTSGSSLVVAENSTGTVYTATGIDPDGEQILSWSLGGSDAALFQVNSLTGELFFNSSPNFEIPLDSRGKNVYDVTVTATDNGTGNLSASQGVTITVTDVNDPPAITSGSSSSFAENGTAMAYVATGIDPDREQVLTWSLGGVDAALFNINSVTAEVFFNSSPDFEIPRDAGANNVYDVTVIAIDNGTGNLSASQAVAVTVTDINEAPVVSYSIWDQYASGVLNFSSQYSSGSWSANQVIGSPNTFGYGDISTAWAPRLASGGMEYITVSFTTPVYSSGVTVRETYGNGFVTQVDALDMSNQLHQVWNGVDTSQPGQPVNFLATWSQTSYLVKGLKIHVDGTHSTTWEEIDAIQHHGSTEVGNLNFVENGTSTVYTAPGAGPAGGQISWSLGGVDAALFNINNLTGVISFNNLPDFEHPLDQGANNVYDITVTTTSGTGNPATNLDVIVTVTDVNEFPSITSGGSAQFAENGIAKVYTAAGTDPDVAQTLSWSLGGVDAAFFNMNSSTGEVFFNRPPNFELPLDRGANNVYDITVIATDSGLGNLTNSRAVAIAVTNVNEAPSVTYATLDQYASQVLSYSSQYSTNSWSANQVIGSPNTFHYGDISTSWATSSMNGGTEHITVLFATPVYASGATIRETYGNGFVTGVDVLDMSNQLHRVWNGTDGSQPGQPVDFLTTWSQTNYQVKGVKVYVNTNHNSYWEEIDSIKLMGSTSLSLQITQNITTAVTGILFADEDGGSGNAVATFTVGSGQLAAASFGGVTVGGSASQLTLTGTIANINDFVGGGHLTYTTSVNANDSLGISINDSGTVGSGNGLTSSMNVAIAVTCAFGDPLVLDLNHDGIHLLSMDDGTRFDMNNDGLRDVTGWIAPDDGLLVLDGDHDGVIEGIGELVSEYLVPDSSSSLVSLASFDQNRDSLVDSKDSVFPHLQIWQDANGDGISDFGELWRLEDLGIVSFGLQAGVPVMPEMQGNIITAVITFMQSDGQQGTMAEVGFHFADSPEAVNSPLIPAAMMGYLDLTPEEIFFEKQLVALLDSAAQTDPRGPDTQELFNHLHGFSGQESGWPAGFSDFVDHHNAFLSHFDDTERPLTNMDSETFLFTVPSDPV